MDPIEQLISEIDAFLEHSGMTATAFGWTAMKDPNFVGDLRAGREPRRRTLERARTFIRENAPERTGAAA